MILITKILCVKLSVYHTLCPLEIQIVSHLIIGYHGELGQQTQDQVPQKRDKAKPGSVDQRTMSRFL